MKKTTSRDGTTIAFDQTGQGAPVILVLGAFNDRMTGAPLAAYLARRFTVLAYDRRGRGDSGDAATYTIDREVEDLDAVIQAAGGAAAVFGYSSGALLALAAAARGLAITRLALYDAPPGQPAEHTQALASLVAAGRRGDAVEYFQRRMVGIPDEVVAQLRHAPFRPALEAMAHTLVYDATIVADGHITAALAEVRQPTLAIAGGAGAPVMRRVAETLAAQLPGGRAVTIEGATHDLAPALLVPVLERFLDG
ncbi:alpha/beta fold hydrolase [Sorangium atrum]|uniref:Alpha/beta hydrolase n=1 Tax=Sorangium atrum TaxID=2995308 RepID=A0ABT5C577_9BACT|nr:alpha/beta hydrolase [Sorangium aterium]MDC0681568.1 alpha/beta hydrolase [Sorangium aterium]